MLRVLKRGWESVTWPISKLFVQRNSICRDTPKVEKNWKYSRALWIDRGRRGIECDVCVCCKMDLNCALIRLLPRNYLARCMAVTELCTKVLALYEERARDEVQVAVFEPSNRTFYFSVETFRTWHLGSFFSASVYAITNQKSIVSNSNGWYCKVKKCLIQINFYIRSYFSKLFETYIESTCIASISNSLFTSEFSCEKYPSLLNSLACNKITIKRSSRMTFAFASSRSRKYIIIIIDYVYPTFHWNH